MHRLKIAILLAPLIAGIGYFCYRSIPTACPFVFDADYRIDGDRASPERVYLFPGIPGDKSQWDAAPHTWLLAALVAEGIDVVSVAVPPARPCYYADGGANYRAAFIEYLDRVVAAVNAREGVKSRSIVGGISYGGLHALMAAELRPQFFSEWFGSFPVTKIAALADYHSLGTSPKFDPARKPALLAGRRGLLLWGTADTTVDFRFTEALFARLDPANVTGIAYSAPHSTTSAQVSAIADWVSRAP